MSNWEDDLKNDATPPQERELQVKERVLSAKEAYCELTVIPTLNKIKTILEEKGKTVTVTPGNVPALKVTAADTPSFEECSYWLTFDATNKVEVHFGYFEKNNVSYQTRQKVLGDIAKVSANDLGNYFRDQYAKTKSVRS